MTVSRTISILSQLQAVTDGLDDCACVAGLRADAPVASVRAATFARLANAERAAGRTPDPHQDILVRVVEVEAEAVRLDQLYRARRQVLGFNAQAEATQGRVVALLDDGAQAGRAWARFLVTQATLRGRLAAEGRLDVSGAVAVHSDGDGFEVGEVADLIGDLAEVA